MDGVIADNLECKPKYLKEKLVEFAYIYPTSHATLSDKKRVLLQQSQRLLWLELH